MGHRTPAAESAKRPCMNESISTESRSPPRFQAGRKADSRGRMISRPLALEIGSCEEPKTTARNGNGECDFACGFVSSMCVVPPFNRILHSHAMRVQYAAVRLMRLCHDVLLTTHGREHPLTERFTSTRRRSVHSSARQTWSTWRDVVNMVADRPLHVAGRRGVRRCRVAGTHKE